MADAPRLKDALQLVLDGKSVSIVIRCRDHYDAMLLYDRLCGQADTGELDLTVDTRGVQ